MNFDKALELLLKTEGGYVNDPDDAGGETIFGISRRQYPNSLVFVRLDEYKAAGNTKPKILTDLCRNSDVFIMISEIYRNDYWNKCCCDQLPVSHRYPIFDCAVNCGAVRASKFYQRAIGVKDDGIIGPKTISAALRSDNDSALPSFWVQWANHYDRLVKADPKQKKFLRGWKNRIKIAKEKAK